MTSNPNHTVILKWFSLGGFNLKSLFFTDMSPWIVSRIHILHKLILYTGRENILNITKIVFFTLDSNWAYDLCQHLVFGTRFIHNQQREFYTEIINIISLSVTFCNRNISMTYIYHPTILIRSDLYELLNVKLIMYVY